MNVSTTPSGNVPTPFVYTPSQEFIGNDGWWSAFVIRVGNPSQNFRVIPATRSGEIYVPIADGCLRGNSTNCGTLRGAYDFNGRKSNGFQVNVSTSWHELGIFDMGVRPELDFNANALYGQDSIGLMVQNSGGPILQKQVIAGVAKPDIFVGMIGLGVKPANFSEFDNPQASLIQTMKNDGHIPSLSYGYTAGAYYKTPKVLGSLTLGGYDQSRFEPNNVTFPFNADDDRSLSVNIQSITAQNTFNDTVNILDLDQPTYAQIDATVPHLWLPVKTCDRIAAAFRLQYDNSTDLYLVNDTTHEILLQKNPTITIGLGATADPAQRVNIVLPYNAFDLQASYPIYPNATNYFPIRRAYNDSMYTLGRTFLQEAYIKVDYERGNFSVHQALFPATTEKQQVVPISSLTTDARAAAIRKGGHIGRGALIGIVVTAVLIFVAIACLLLRCLRERSRLIPSVEPRVTETSEELADESKVESDGPALYEADGVQYYELYYEGLQMVVSTGPRFELSGSSPCELSSHLDAKSKDLDIDVGKKEVET